MKSNEKSILVEFLFKHAWYQYIKFVNSCQVVWPSASIRIKALLNLKSSCRPGQCYSVYSVVMGTKWCSATGLQRLGQFYLKTANAANEYKKKKKKKKKSPWRMQLVVLLFLVWLFRDLTFIIYLCSYVYYNITLHNSSLEHTHAAADEGETAERVKVEGRVLILKDLLWSSHWSAPRCVCPLKLRCFYVYNEQVRCHFHKTVTVLQLHQMHTVSWTYQWSFWTLLSTSCWHH